MGYKEIVSDALSILDVFKAPPELREKFIQMREYTLDLREKYSDLKEQFINQKEEFSELLQQLNDKDKMEFDKQYYWKVTEKDEKEGPFCSGCYAGEKRQKVRLHEAQQKGWWDCPVCKTHVTDSTYAPPDISVPYTGLS